MSGPGIDFQAVKAALGMELLLEAYGIQLDWKMGEELRGRCPLPQHSSQESRESFRVHTAKNVWICHSQSCIAARGGAAGGDVLDFVAALERCTIAEAARRLWTRFGAGSPWRNTGEATGVKKNEGRVGNSARGPAEKQNPPLRFVLHPVNGRHPYLAERGIEPATAQYFQVGYYAGPGLLQGRIVIPLHDWQGRLVGYAGRAIDGSPPRYKFPPGFQKSVALFNLHRVQHGSGRQVVVVEGFFDCLHLHQAGFPQVLALMGSSLSAVQQELLRRHFQAVVLMLDGDEAGQRATRRLVSQLGSQMAVRWAKVPAGQQPDQLTVAAIRSLVENASSGTRQGSDPHPYAGAPPLAASF